MFAKRARLERPGLYDPSFDGPLGGRMPSQHDTRSGATPHRAATGHRHIECRITHNTVYDLGQYSAHFDQKRPSDTHMTFVCPNLYSLLRQPPPSHVRSADPWMRLSDRQHRPHVWPPQGLWEPHGW